MKKCNCQTKQKAHSENAFDGVRPTIGVMGGASPLELDPDIMKKAEIIGREIAKHDCILITGATTGYPYYAAKGCKETCGFSVGISPAKGLWEHIEKYHLPTDYMDVIIYTASGFNARNATNISSSNAVITIGGRAGTLNEFTAAYDTGKIIGILKGSGGISDGVDEILKFCYKKDSKAILIQESDPVALVKKVYKHLVERKEQIQVEADQTVI